MKQLFNAVCLLLSCAPMYANGGDRPIPCESSWWVDGEFLYWKTFLGEGIEYADSVDPLAGIVLGNAEAKFLTFNTKPGARAKLGYINHVCKWDATVGYTYYHNHAHASQTGTLFPTLLSFGVPDTVVVATVANAQASWHLNFQYVDLDFGRPIWWGCFFALHPHIGARGAWINQCGNVTYSGGDLAVTVPISLKNNFWGCGFKVGLDANYQITPCFSVFSDVSGSLLWGNFDVRQTQNIAGVNQIKLHEEFSQLNPTAEGVLGIAWQQHLGGWWCPLLVISAAVEGQYWWRQNHIERFTAGGAVGSGLHIKEDQDLGLFGLTAKATLYF